MPNYLLPGVTTIPSALLILSISQTSLMQIGVVLPTFVLAANTYIVGMAVRLVVPRSFGMYQANGLVGVILSMNPSGSNWTLNLDSSQFDPYIIPPVTQEVPASVSPAGSRNLQYNNNTGIVPFQSLNNIGN